MKKYTIYVFLLVIVSSFLFFYAGSCNKGLDYYVKFTATSETESDEIVLGLGLEGYSENAFANVINGETASTLFVATSGTGGSDSSILIAIGGIVPGTYTFQGDNFLTISYADSGIPYGLDSTFSTASLTVTSFGEEGETIEGTFTATLYRTLQLDTKAAAPTPDVTITDGSFRVKRIADDTYNPGAN
jgi:hypothetical protein